MPCSIGVYTRQIRSTGFNRSPSKPYARAPCNGSNPKLSWRTNEECNSLSTSNVVPGNLALGSHAVRNTGERFFEILGPRLASDSQRWQMLLRGLRTPASARRLSSARPGFRVASFQVSYLWGVGVVIERTAPPRQRIFLERRNIGMVSFLERGRRGARYPHKAA